MAKKFAEWLKQRDKNLVEELTNEGVFSWFRRHPGVSKGLQTATLAGALGHGYEAMPHGSEAEPESGPVEKMPFNPKDHEDKRREAETELQSHFVAENSRRLNEIAEKLKRKYKKNPNDPKFKLWLLNLAKRISGLRNLEFADIIKLPSKMVELITSAANRTVDQIQHMLGELPEGESDPDTQHALNQIAQQSNISTGINPIPGSPTYNSPMNRTQYRHRKQHRSGY